MGPGHTAEQITRINEAYHNAIVDQYDVRLEDGHPAVLRRYREIFDRHVLPRLGARARVIDLGCGSGYLEQFLPAGRQEVTGIDIAEKMLAAARRKFPRASFIKGDIYRYGQGQQYDLVMERSVLHHLLDWRDLVARMIELTGPGGVLVISNEPNAAAYRALTPLKYLFRRLVNRERGRAAREKLGDENFEKLAEYQLFYGSGFAPREIRELLLRSGFKKVVLFFSLRELLATLEERWPWLRLNSLIPGFLLDHFPLSRNFDLVAYR